MENPAQRKKEHWFYGTESVDQEELNSVEFPLALLARQIPKALRESKRLEFKDSILDAASKQRLERSLVISANSETELPNYWDQDALIALQVLTGRKHQWESETVAFSLYEILQLMRLPNDGRNSQRLVKSLDNWQGIRFKYSHWRKNGTWVHPKAFGIIQHYDITRGPQKGRCEPNVPQEFAWSKIFFDSIREQNTKPFDANFYYDLKLPTSRRFYRFSDKRLYNRSFYTKPIVPFCEDKLGMAPNQKPSKLQKNISPAYDELVSKRFLADIAPEKRFTRGKDGTLYINFRRGPGRKNRSSVSVPSTVHSDEQQAMIDRGCSTSKVEELREKHQVSAERMTLVVEWFDWEQKRKTKMPNPGGWMFKACVEEWLPPAGFKNAEERAAESAAKKERQQKIQFERAREADELRKQKESQKAAEKRFEAIRNSYSLAEQLAMEDSALEECEEFTRNYILKGRREGKTGHMQQHFWEQHIIPKLNQDRDSAA